MNDMNALNEEFAQPVEASSNKTDTRTKLIMGTAGIALIGVVAWAGITVFGDSASSSAGVSPVAV